MAIVTGREARVLAIAVRPRALSVSESGTDSLAHARILPHTVGVAMYLAWTSETAAAGRIRGIQVSGWASGSVDAASAQMSPVRRSRSRRSCPASNKPIGSRIWRYEGAVALCLRHVSSHQASLPNQASPGMNAMMSDRAAMRRSTGQDRATV